MTTTWRCQGTMQVVESLCAQLGVPAHMEDDQKKTTTPYNLISKAMRDALNAAIRDQEQRVFTLTVAIKRHQRYSRQRGEALEAHNLLLYAELDGAP